MINFSSFTKCVFSNIHLASAEARVYVSTVDG
uniref:Uncharacterized protein n=1 Tax=Anguilla anguilla TaxID=7936 RepID=A0A0E9QX67_ANGAN